MIIMLLKARKPDPYTGDLFGDGQAHILFTKPTPEGWKPNAEQEGKFWIGYYHGRTQRDAPLPD